MSQWLAASCEKNSRRTPMWEIVGEADTGISALRGIASLRPDLVFLDLQMPEMGGFEVIQQLRGGKDLPLIIIVTAYDQYAVKALDEGAIDYLLKPVGQTRLEKALDRARGVLGNKVATAEQLARLQEIGATAPTPSRPRKIVGRAGEEYFLLSATEVLAFQADGEVVWIITGKQRYLATQSLRRIEEKLQGSEFPENSQRAGQRGPCEEACRLEQQPLADHAKQQPGICGQ